MKKRGFTLIELVVVVAIIGILAVIILVSYSGASRKSRDSKRKADLNAIASAMMIYYSEKKTMSSIQVGKISDANVLVTEKYLVDLPVDPSGATNNYWITRSAYEGSVYAKMDTPDRMGDQCFRVSPSPCINPPSSYNYGLRVKP